MRLEIIIVIVLLIAGVVFVIKKMLGRKSNAGSTEKDFFGDKKGSVTGGAVRIVLSIIGLLWLSPHAPSNTTSSGIEWRLNEFPYYAILAFLVWLGVYGLVNLVRGLILQQKNSPTEPLRDAALRCAQCGDAVMQGAGFCSRCGAPATQPPELKISPESRCEQCGCTVEKGVARCPSCAASHQEARDDNLHIRWLCAGHEGRGCGHKLKVKKESVGKQVICPKCQLKQVVPQVGP